VYFSLHWDEQPGAKSGSIVQFLKRPFLCQILHLFFTPNFASYFAPRFGFAFTTVFASSFVPFFASIFASFFSPCFVPFFDSIFVS